jgi:hypothetical protein
VEEDDRKYEEALDQVLGILEDHDGCCLDNEDERLKVAKDLVRNIMGLDDPEAMKNCGPVYDSVPGTDLPKPTVKLVGEDGNAYAIMGRVSEALRRVGAPRHIITQYTKEATSGDYDNLLRVTTRYVNAV